MDRLGSASADGDRLRCLSHRLLRGQCGHSAVEYAALLGLLMLVAGAGAAWLGISSTRSLSLLTGRLTGQLPATLPAGNPDGNAVSSAEASRFERTPDKRDRTMSASWLFLAVGAGMIGLACILLGRRRYRCEQPLLPQDESEEPNLEERLCTKRQHLLRLLAQDPAILFKNQLAVRHLMTTDIITVSPGATRQRTGELMREAHVRHLLVCGPGQQLLGMVSDRDLGGKPGKTAGDLMSTQVKTVAPDTLISPAATQVIRAGISSLAVVEDGRLCGILTTTDLVLALQCLLQLWLHAAVTMQSEAWEQKLMETVQSQLDTAGADTCRGVKGVVESLVGAQARRPDQASGQPGCPLARVGSGTHRYRGHCPARLESQDVRPSQNHARSVSGQSCAPLGQAQRGRPKPGGGVRSCGNWSFLNPANRLSRYISESNTWACPKLNGKLWQRAGFLWSR